MQQTQPCPEGAGTLVAMPPHPLEIVSLLPQHPFLAVQTVRLLIPTLKCKFFPQTFPNLSLPEGASLCDTHRLELCPLGMSHATEILVFSTMKFSFSTAILCEVRIDKQDSSTYSYKCITSTA